MKNTRRSRRKRNKIKGLLFFIIFVVVSAVAGLKFFNSSNYSLTAFLGGGKTVSTQSSTDNSKNTADDVQSKIDEKKKQEVKIEKNKVEDDLNNKKIEENKAKEETIKKEQSEQNKEVEKKNTALVQQEGKKGNKIAYLTFDDGPSHKITPQILDVLKGYNIKATFFVIGSMAEENPALLKREKEDGHVIANHTYSHNYKNIYSSTTNFINDLKKGENVVSSIIGEHNSKLIRFPGGSFGRTAYKQAVTNAGYHYVDWNALNGDAEAPYVSKERLVSRLKETVGGQNTLYILMHDAPGKQSTVQALPEIIEYLKSQGYEFRTLQ